MPRVHHYLMSYAMWNKFPLANWTRKSCWKMDGEMDGWVVQSSKVILGILAIQFN